MKNLKGIKTHRNNDICSGYIISNNFSTQDIPPTDACIISYEYCGFISFTNSHSIHSSILQLFYHSSIRQYKKK